MVDELGSGVWRQPDPAFRPKVIPRVSEARARDNADSHQMRQHSAAVLLLAFVASAALSSAGATASGSAAPDVVGVQSGPFSAVVRWQVSEPGRVVVEVGWTTDTGSGQRRASLGAPRRDAHHSAVANGDDVSIPGRHAIVKPLALRDARIAPDGPWPSSARRAQAADLPRRPGGEATSWRTSCRDWASP